jgi:microcystin-dependent protein
VAQPYVGEIRLFAGNFAPAGWEFCDGQLLPISENETLFQLIGTTYGGDGQATFALPDLRSRVPIHWGAGAGDTYPIAAQVGVESVTLTTQHLPGHSHALLASADVATLVDPAGKVSGQTGTFDGYQSTAGAVPMAAQSLGPVGGSQPHENVQPFVCINYIISLFGIFPSPT